MKNWSPRQSVRFCPCPELAPGAMGKGLTFRGLPLPSGQTAALGLMSEGLQPTFLLDHLPLSSCSSQNNVTHAFLTRTHVAAIHPFLRRFSSSQSHLSTSQTTVPESSNTHSVQSPSASRANSDVTKYEGGAPGFIYLSIWIFQVGCHAGLDITHVK